MSYISMPFGQTRTPFGKVTMNIQKSDRFDREITYFIVDGRVVEVPTEMEMLGAADVTTLFALDMATDAETQEVVSKNIQTALAKFIEEGCTKEKVKFRIITE